MGLRVMGYPGFRVIMGPPLALAATVALVASDLRGFKRNESFRVQGVGRVAWGSRRHGSGLVVSNACGVPELGRDHKPVEFGVCESENFDF